MKLQTLCGMFLEQEYLYLQENTADYAYYLGCWDNGTLSNTGEYLTNWHVRVAKTDTHSELCPAAWVIV